MLLPAVMFKDEIEMSFQKYLYSRDFFLYAGYKGDNTIPDIKTEDDSYQYAIVDLVDEDDYDSTYTLVGFFSYGIDVSTDSVREITMFSFQRDKYNIFCADIVREFKKLIKEHHRIEWVMTGTNPAKPVYDWYCKKYNGNSVVLHDAIKDGKQWIDQYIYEIVNKEN